MAHRLAHDGEAAHLALAVHDFLVGQHGAQPLAPPDRLLGDVGEAFRVTVGATLLLGCAVGGKLQRGNGLSLVRLRVEPRVIDLEENPLCPAEVAGVGRGEFARPVVAEAEGFNLPREVGDVRLGGDARMLAGLDGVLLGRQAEGIPTHRMKHVEPLRAPVAGEDVRGRVTLRMPHVQPRARRVGKHVEDVKLRRQRSGGGGLPRDGVARPEWMPLRHGVAGVEGAESLLRVPRALPLGLNQIKRILSATRHRAGIIGAAQKCGQWRSCAGRTVNASASSRSPLRAFASPQRLPGYTIPANLRLTQ